MGEQQKYADNIHKASQATEDPAAAELARAATTPRHRSGHTGQFKEPAVPERNPKVISEDAALLGPGPAFKPPDKP